MTKSEKVLALLYPVGYNSTMDSMKNLIRELITERGEAPYSHWLEQLKDVKAKAAIISHVDRMELGLFSDSKPVGKGVMELRIHVGPGYRIYYAQEKKAIYLLLCGGNKLTQKNDIIKAQKYWQKYQKEVSYDDSKKH